MEMTCSLLCVLVDKMKETDHAHFLTAKMRDMWLKGQVQPITRILNPLTL